jgi:hypothetical protein
MVLGFPLFLLLTFQELKTPEKKKQIEQVALFPCLHLLILKFNSSLPSLLQDLEAMRRKLESLGDTHLCAFVFGIFHAFEILQASTAQILLAEASHRLHCLLLRRGKADPLEHSFLPTPKLMQRWQPWHRLQLHFCLQSLRRRRRPFLSPHFFRQQNLTPLPTSHCIMMTVSPKAVFILSCCFCFFPPNCIRDITVTFIVAGTPLTASVAGLFEKNTRSQAASAVAHAVPVPVTVPVPPPAVSPQHTSRQLHPLQVPCHACCLGDLPFDVRVVFSDE